MSEKYKKTKSQKRNDLLGALSIVGTMGLVTGVGMKLAKRSSQYSVDYAKWAEDFAKRQKANKQRFEDWRDQWRKKYKERERYYRQKRAYESQGRTYNKSPPAKPIQVKETALKHIDDDNFDNLKNNTLSPVSIASLEKFKDAKDPVEKEFLKKVRVGTDRAATMKPKDFRNSEEYENIRSFIDKYDFNKNLKYIADFALSEKAKETNKRKTYRNAAITIVGIGGAMAISPMIFKRSQKLRGSEKTFIENMENLEQHSVKMNEAHMKNIEFLDNLGNQARETPNYNKNEDLEYFKNKLNDPNNVIEL